MLAAFLFSALRKSWTKSFRTLPPLANATPVAPLPASVNCLRFSLMRALQHVRLTCLYQFGDKEFSECYTIGNSPLQPVIANILIRNGWVVPGQPHWVEAIIQYHLSTAGLAVESQLEAWWAGLTLEQRLRAALLE